MRDANHDLQLHQPLAEQVQRPAGASVRRRRAGQHRHLRLALAVQLARLAFRLRAATQGGFEAV